MASLLNYPDHTLAYLGDGLLGRAVGRSRVCGFLPQHRGQCAVKGLYVVEFFHRSAF